MKTNKKFMGFREGDKFSSKKNVDHMNYGYPMELRNRASIRIHIQDKLTKEELREAGLI